MREMSERPLTMSGVLDGYMTADELAGELHLAISTLKGWRVRKTGPPYIKVGRDILYSRDAVRHWLAGLATKRRV